MSSSFIHFEIEIEANKARRVLRLSKNKHNEYYLPIVRSPFPKFPEVSLSIVFSTSLCVS